jgi:hypothetical protein
MDFHLQSELLVAAFESIYLIQSAGSRLSTTAQMYSVEGRLKTTTNHTTVTAIDSTAALVSHVFRAIPQLGMVLVIMMR